MTKKPFRLWPLSLVLLAVSVVVLLPFVWMTLTSLKPEGEIMSRPDLLLPQHPILDQYGKIFTAVPFFRFFLNSLIFAGGVTILSLFFDSIAGYAFAKLNFPGRSFLFVAVLVTLMVPFQITMTPLYLMIFQLHGLDTYWGLILPRMTNAFGIYLMRQAFLSVPNELLDAGRIDGLREFAIFRRVALPLVSMSLVTLAVFHFMYNWNDFLWPLLVTNVLEMRTLSVGLSLFMGEHVMDHGPILAGAVLSIVPLLVFFLAAQKTFTQGIALSGLKG
jgi:multiple sugar transport system permease protein